MATNSSSAGFLAPSSQADYDEALDVVIHDTIVGLTGIKGDLVRPRWQLEPPQQPAFNVNWVAFGLVRTSVDVFAYDHHNPQGNNSSIDRDELLYFLHSFYGPQAHSYCERFRDGLEIAQNRAVLEGAGIGVVEVGEATILPALLKEKWVRRVDAMVTYRRRTSRVYPVLTVQSGQAILDNEVYVTPINVNTP